VALATRSTSFEKLALASPLLITSMTRV
jgi:hypothetical protein